MAKTSAAPAAAKPRAETSQPTDPPAEQEPKARSQKDKERLVRQNLTQKNRLGLYQVARLLGGETRDRVGMRVPCKVYVQDPAVAARLPKLGLNEVTVRWEPGLADGPTSSRVAVVDYDADTGKLETPAAWNQEAFAFCGEDGEPVAARPKSAQFRQVGAWTQVQRVLELYEDASALGRPVPWGFDGNRLLVVPHAGYQENAFYDRRSKSLQLYYFGEPGELCHTCLSQDIVAHETGHAILDGVRPYFLENSSWETPAFHEFVGDLTAILLTLRTNGVRKFLVSQVGTNLAAAKELSGLAEEFGRRVRDRPFLRSARNRRTYAEAAAARDSHAASEVMTGAMFDILVALARQYLSPKRQAERKVPATGAKALWWASDGMDRIALQALDLLPPADVRFADYARAVLRHHELADPEDPHRYRPRMRRIFHRRGLCPRPYRECVKRPKDCALAPAPEPRFDVYHPIFEIARSRTAAYQFLHDNRKALKIPASQDFEVVDLYDAVKLARGADRLPRQVVLEYLWREAVPLEGPDLEGFHGRSVALSCGGTLVFDDRGNLLSWAFKRGRGTSEGTRRREELLRHVAAKVAARQVAFADTVEAGLPAGVAVPPVIARDVGGVLHLETAARGCALDEASEEDPWETSFF